MTSRCLILSGVFLLFPLHPSIGLSGTKTWTQSTTTDFAGNQLMNISPAPSGGVWIAHAFSKTSPDHFEDAPHRFTAKDGAGRFVATWVSGGNVYAQRYSSAGVALGATIAVNDSPAGADPQCSAALFDDGTYIVVWNDSYLAGTLSGKMQGQIIKFDDTKRGSNFFIYDTANDAGECPAAFANNADQTFWIFAPLQAGQAYKIYVQKMDKNGNKTGNPFPLDTGNLTIFERGMAVSAVNGGFAVAWEGSNGESSWDSDIYLREYSLAGTAVTPTNKVNDDQGLIAQSQPALCWDENTNLFVVWEDYRYASQQGGSEQRVCGQVFDSQCTRIGANVPLEDTDTLYSRYPEVEYSSGQYHVSWLAWNRVPQTEQTMTNTWGFAPITSGMMISSVFDAGPGGTSLKSISWMFDGATHGSVQMKVKSADVLTNLLATPWHGPADTAGLYTIPSGEQIGTFAAAGRFVQYAAFLNSLDGQSPLIHSVSITYANLDSIPPAKPSSLLATPGHHSIALSWDSNRETDLAGYFIYRGTKSGTYDGNWKKTVPAGQTSFVDYSALLDTVYFFAVSAFDSCHNESPLSNEATCSSGKISIYVTQEGSIAGDGSLLNPFPTITQGLRIALEGDTVVVLDGTFSEVLKIPAGVSLVGTGPQRCTISSWFDLHDRSFLSGFTLTSLLRCVDGRPVVSDNTFLTTSVGPPSGLAIQVLDASAPSILRNYIVSPTFMGTGIQDLSAQTHVIRNNIIVASDVGIDLPGYGGPAIINNTIVASTLGAINSGTTYPVVIINNVLISNGQYHVPALEFTPQASAVVLYNDIVPPLTTSTGTGNISLDPLFVDPTTQNFHLQAGSPARDAGDPDMQYRDPDGSRNDMGAFGGPDPYPEKAPAPLVRSITLTGGSASPGDTASLTVLIDDPRGVRQAGFTLEFDPSLLSLLSLVPGTPGELIYNVSPFGGGVSFSFDANGPLQTGQESLVKVLFFVNPKSVAGNASPVTFKSASLIDANHQPVVLRSVSSGTVVVNQYTDGKHHVFVDAGNTGTENGTRLHPWKSIMKGMTAASAGDSILVAGGIYSEEVLMKDSVHLVGSGAPVTILLAPSDQPAVMFESMHAAEVTGFTLRADGNHQPAWPLIMCSASSPVVRLNRFDASLASQIGIHCYNGGNPAVQNNYFFGTTVLVAGTSPLLEGNVIEAGNGPGGGITCSGGASPVISRNRIDGASGSGIMCNGGTAVISDNWIICGMGPQPALLLSGLTSAAVRNNIIFDTSSHGIGMSVSSSSGVDVINNTLVTHLRGVVESNSSVNLMNNIITGNGDRGLQGSSGTASNYNDLWANTTNYSGVSPGVNDFSGDPLFRNLLQGDLRLAVGSPCINAGNPSVEYLDRDGSRNDVGAFGGPNADSTWYVTNAARLAFDSVTSTTSDTVQIPLRGVNITGMAGLSLTLSYDPATLRILEARAGSATKRFSVTTVQVSKGYESISLTSGSGIADEKGDVLSLVCAIQTSYTGTTVIHCDSAQMFDAMLCARGCGLPRDCSIAIIPTGVRNPGGESLPAKFSLLPNYPNPFNPSTNIAYDVPRTSVISLAMYDILGRLVATLVNGSQVPGRHVVEWNAAGLASGVYLCRLQSGNFMQVKKVLLLK
jgi:hypothetical protein